MSPPPRSTPRPGEETPSDPSCGGTTTFPVPIARGASFDPALEEEIGAAIGAESRASGTTLTGTICVNLLRHPAWARAQETYGEDPLHVGEMAAAATRGLQRHVLACMELALGPVGDAPGPTGQVDVAEARVRERVLHEVDLPHVRCVAREGVAAAMVNGAWPDENRELLTSILRDEWGWDGFVISDVVPGGNDVAELDATRVVDTLPRFRHLFDGAAVPPPSVVASPAHREIARRASVASMVLLRNDDLLPLDPSAPGRIAVLGPLADVADPGDGGSGDGGSSDVHPPTAVTPFEGIRSAFTIAEVVHHDGRAADGTIADVDALTEGAATVIVVVGDTKPDDAMAPGGDRASLRLAPADESLIAAAAAAHDRVVVVVMAGSAVVAPWTDTVDAVLLLWHPGMEGGAALGDVLSGWSEPGGRLPFVVPHDEADLVPFDRDAERVTPGTVTHDLLHGQWWLDHHYVEPHFSFGAGQGYTTWDVVTASVAPAPDDPSGVTAHVTVDVRNTGRRDGSTVLFVFAGVRDSDVVRPPRRLVGFRRVHESAGASARVVVPVDLAHLDVRLDGRWSREPGSYQLEVCRRAGDPAAVHLDVTVA